jgi:hypothetical protein
MSQCISNSYFLAIEKMFGEVLEPLLVFLAADRPFAELLDVVSQTSNETVLRSVTTRA